MCYNRLTRSMVSLIALIPLFVLFTSVTAKPSVDDDSQPYVFQPSVRCDDELLLLRRRRRDATNDENKPCYFRDVFTLTCLYEDRVDLQQISWRHNGEVADPKRVASGRIKGSNTTQGYYQCVVNTSIGPIVSPVILVQQAALTMSTKISSQSVKSGQMAVLNCPYVAVGPVITVAWSFKKKKRSGPVRAVDCSDGRCLQLHNGTLLMLSVSDEHAGTYKCLVSNTLQGSELESLIELGVLPSTETPNTLLTYHSESPVTIANGAKPTLTCIFENRTNALLKLDKIVWFATSRGDVTVGQGWQYQPEAAGVYQCVGVYTISERPFNQTGVNITVTAEEGSRIVRWPEKQTVIAGSRATLACAATGFPVPTVAWIVDGKILDGKSGNFENGETTWNVTPYRVGINNTISSLLHVDPLYGSHVVQCNASNVHATELASSYVITVDSLPEPSSTTTTTTIIPTTTTRDIPSSSADGVRRMTSTSSARRRPPTTLKTLKPTHRLTTTAKQPESTPQKLPATREADETTSLPFAGTPSTPFVAPNGSVMVIVTAAFTSGGIVVLIAIIVAITVCIVRHCRQRERKRRKQQEEAVDKVNRNLDKKESSSVELEEVGLSRSGSIDSGISEIPSDQPFLLEVVNQRQPQLQPIEEQDETVSLSAHSVSTSRSRHSNLYDP